MAGRNGKKTVGSLVLSLGVCVVTAGVVYLFVPHDDSKETPVPRVDYRVELLSARRAAPYPVAAPEGLSKSWKATSVRYEAERNETWHLGFLDPDGQYVAVEQSTDKPARFIDDASQGAEATSGKQSINGAEWQRYKGDKYDALVLKEKGSTTVVTGTAGFGQLTKMAESLKMERAESA
ncbi:DUF4245 domain-containing protein [Streptomyces sp. VRA16 Mangrove soil]|uniref:DUF4245 domain-containing protein n=1 Tax=Streptomyces sp. VRA16 Mangrove soil TaxID=2817434 RepID=UPI001A9F5F55|nr:DUF4245 domain-containing protein [Streptomyces sp. VRA16 Mangrove soil]MBO1334630.1 DUF4245 domain-containing protein [Streptomyces sp. VRA16 Mangrove soil]